MAALQTLVEDATEAMKAVGSSNLSVDGIQRSAATLDSLGIQEAIDAYSGSLPPKPEQEDQVPAWEKKMQEQGKTLNHAIHGLNNELSRIKNLRNTLNLAELDPLIRAAQSVIRPLYDFTAELGQSSQ